LQVPQSLGNPGSYPPGYVKFAGTDPDNQCVLPNGHYRVRLLLLWTPPCCKNLQSFTTVCGCMQVLIKVYKALGTDKDYVAFSQRFKAAHPGYRPGECVAN